MLWNPWISGGAPDCADPQIGVFSPVSAGLGLLFGPGLRGFAVYWLLIWWWGAAGVLLLARHLRAPAWGAAIAAVGFACSGFYVGHAQHTAILVSLSWLPFTVWRLDVALRSASWRAAAQAGACWGLSALSGYPALTVLSGCYMALWVLGHLVRGGLSRATLARAAAALLLATSIGLVVLSPAYWAFFRDGRGYTDRTESLPRELATGSNSLHPGALATFASPYVAVLDLLDEELWPYTESSSASIYLPAAVLVLAALALCRRQRWRLYLAAVAALMLGCALGEALPLRGWLYDFFPPARYFRHAVVFRGYYVFTAVVLALLAARDLAAPSRRLWRRFAVLSLAAAASAALALGVTGALADLSGSHFFLAATVALALWLGCAVTAWRGIARRTSAIAALVVLACVDGGAAIRMSRYFVIAWDDAAREIWRRVDAARDHRLDLLRSGWRRHLRSRFGEDPNNRNVMAREAALAGHVGLRSTLLDRWLQSAVLTAAVTGDRRFYFAPQAVEVPWTQDALAAFADRGEEIGSLPIVVHDRDAVLSGNGRSEDASMSRIADLPPAQPARVELLRYEPEALELRIEAPEAGYLLVADRFARGWRATVDGGDAELLPAWFLFRAVAVPEGTHRVVMVYRPAGHPWLVAVSWATLALVGVLWARPVQGVKPGSGGRLTSPAPAGRPASTPRRDARGAARPSPARRAAGAAGGSSS